MTTPQNSHRARARLSDPYTSQQAAAVATRNLPTVRATVLAILEETGESMTHDQIIADYGRRRMNGQAAKATDSSIRSRCNELERDGLVVVLADTRGRSRHGNPSHYRVARTVYDQWTDRPAIVDRAVVTS